MPDPTPAPRIVGGRPVPAAPLTSAQPAAPAVPAAELGRGDLLDALTPAGHLSRWPAWLEILAGGNLGDLLDQLRPFAVGDAFAARVDWTLLVDALDQRCARSELNAAAARLGGSGEALARIAASLAAGHPVNLQAMLGRLDKTNRRVVLAALFTATGLGGSIDGIQR